MNLGNIAVTTTKPFSPIQVVDGVVTIQPVENLEKTITIPVELFVRNFLYSTLGTDFQVLGNPNSKEDFAVFQKGRLVGRFGDTAFRIALHDFHPANEEFVEYVTEKLAPVFAGDVKLDAETSSCQYSEDTVLKIHPNTGMFIFEKTIDGQQVSLGFHPNTLFLSLIDSAKNKEASSFINPDIAYNGVVFRAHIQQSLVDGVGAVKVNAVESPRTVKDKHVPFVAEVLKNFKPYIFEVDFKKIGLDKEQIKNLYLQSVKLYINLLNRDANQRIKAAQPQKVA